jgi:hypothetical protein
LEHGDHVIAVIPIQLIGLIQRQPVFLQRLADRMKQRR